MDLDKPCLCPDCKTHMQVSLPIWVTPGDDHIDVAEIDYDSSNADCDAYWWCPECQDHHFPLDND